MLNFLIYIINLYLIISYPICKEGVDFCYLCNFQKTQCIKCEKDLYIPNDKGGCSYFKKCKVGKNNCMECSINGDECKLCDNDYYPDENGGCSYTDNCIISENGICLKCKENYILIGIDKYFFNNGAKICKSLDSYDLKYCDNIDRDTGSCLRCIKGYYLGNDDKKCTNIENCEESVYGECKKCKKNYYLNKKENKCIEGRGIFNNCQESSDGNKCNICDLGYYLDDNGQCAFVNFCSEQNSVGKCLKCKQGYYLSENYNSCTPEKNCFSGNKDLGFCDSCNYNYYLDLKNRACIPNTEDNIFKYCREGDEVCKSCIYQYDIGEDNKCSTSHNCVESNNGICNKCKEGYHLGLDNKCNNINHCIYSSYFNQCLECEDNYFYDRRNNTCILANDNFKNCKAGYAEYNCQECKNNFYLNQTDFLCYNNTVNSEYYKCAIISKPWEKCLRCEEGYYIGEKDSICSKIEGCALSENENWCLECSDNFCLNAKIGKCIYNKEIYDEEEKLYFGCKKTNKDGNTCEICEGNYILNEDGLCVDEEHCVENKNGICQDCLKEVNNTFCLNNNFGCVSTYDFGCWECNYILDFYNCTKCYEGYELDKLFNYCRKMEE